MFQDLNDLDVVEGRERCVVVEDVEDRVGFKSLEHVSGPVRVVRGGGVRV